MTCDISTRNGIYVCFDGDRIGEVIQLHLMSNDLQGAQCLSRRVESYVDEIVANMKSQGAALVFRGGDSLIFHTTSEVIETNILHIFPDLTFSVGIGASIEKATIGLFKAKATGRAKIVRI
jgi:hypothetical protein